VQYYLQFAAGLGELVARSLDQDLRNVKQLYVDDSSLIIESASDLERVARVDYVKNAFLVLTSVPRKSLPKSVAEITARINGGKFLDSAPQRCAFRVMVSVDGELSPVDRNLRARLEDVIARRTQSRVNPRGMGEEYWIIGRRDLDTYAFCLRLQRKRDNYKPPRGALSSELSSMLIRASEPQRSDVFLDPFGGRGSIPLARLRFPARRVIYSDINYAELKSDLPPALVRAKAVEFLDEDALRLPSIHSGSINVIVTDPPWGEYEQLRVRLEQFVGEAVDSFDRVLDERSGRFVVLIARRVTNTLIESLNARSFEIEDSVDILVNGHPATVVCGHRGPRNGIRGVEGSASPTASATRIDAPAAAG
jgi:hypothetical protein